MRLMDKLKATIVGKVQLPESTIRDANRRSAPRDPNSVDPRASGTVPVAILGSAEFDVADVDEP